MTFDVITSRADFLQIETAFVIKKWNKVLQIGVDSLQIGAVITNRCTAAEREAFIYHCNLL